MIKFLSGMLEKLTRAIVNNINWETGTKGGKIKILKVITDPFTKMVIQVSKA